MAEATAIEAGVAEDNSLGAEAQVAVVLQADQPEAQETDAAVAEVAAKDIQTTHLKAHADSISDSARQRGIARDH